MESHISNHLSVLKCRLYFIKFFLNKYCDKSFKNLLFKRAPKAKSSPFFLWHIFAKFMEKEPCTKLCVVLV